MNPKRPPVAILIAVSALGPVALNLPLPSFPGMQRVFATDYGTVQLALSLFLVGLAIAQLVYGPLSDRFGRRPVLLAGLGVYIAGSVICLLAPTIGVLIGGRVLQAIGGCAGLVLSRAMVRDMFDRERAASMLAYVTMAMVVAPMVAPSVGGLLDVWFGWWAGFVLMVALGVGVFAASLAILHETHHGDRAPIGFVDMVLGFVRLGRRRVFMGYALCVAFSTAMFHSFLGGAPYVMVDLMGQTPLTYGLYFMFSAGAFMVGNLAAARLTPRLGIDRMMGAGLVLAVSGASASYGFHLAGLLNAETLIGSMALASFGHGMSMPNGLVGAISVEVGAAGAASGLAGFLQMSIGAAASFLVGWMLADTATPLVAALLLTGLLATASFLIGVRPWRAAGPKSGSLS